MYPRSEGGPCALEELVREGMPPMPKKKFKKVAIKLVYGLGNTFLLPKVSNLNVNICRRISSKHGPSFGISKRP